MSALFWFALGSAAPAALKLVRHWLGPLVRASWKEARQAYLSARRAGVTRGEAFALAARWFFREVGRSVGRTLHAALLRRQAR